MNIAEQILASGGTPIDADILDQSNTSRHWKQCWCCMNVYPYSMFKKDLSMKEGVVNQCEVCARVPRLSLSEHVSRLKEINNSLVATKNQRPPFQDELKGDECRLRNYLHHTEFIHRLHLVVPHFNEYIVMVDGLPGNISFYKAFPCLQRDGSDSLYLGFLPMGRQPEFNTYKFNERDVLVRANIRGWRPLLVRFIQVGLSTEERMNYVFGPPEGEGSEECRRKLFYYRNRK
jgi:hypothetical protein